MPRKADEPRLFETRTEAQKIAERCPMKEIMSYWNSKSGIRRCLELTEYRRRHLRARWSDELFRERWKDVIDAIAASAGCTGSNDRGWKAGFDWFLRPGKAVAVLEGTYDGSWLKHGPKDYEPTPPFDPKRRIREFALECRESKNHSERVAGLSDTEIWRLHERGEL